MFVQPPMQLKGSKTSADDLINHSPLCHTSGGSKVKPPPTKKKRPNKASQKKRKQAAATSSSAPTEEVSLASDGQKKRAKPLAPAASVAATGDSVDRDVAAAAGDSPAADQAIDSDSDDDAVLLSDLAVVSASDPMKWPKVNKVSDFASRVEVKGDGNCGHRAVDEALTNAGNPIYPNGRPSKPITSMREAMCKDIDENRTECFGTGRKEDNQLDHLKVVCHHSYHKDKKTPFWPEYSVTKGGQPGRHNRRCPRQTVFACVCQQHLQLIDVVFSGVLADLGRSFHCAPPCAFSLSSLCQGMGEHTVSLRHRC